MDVTICWTTVHKEDTYICGLLVIIAGDVACETEISNLQDVVIGNKYITGRQISMDTLK